jgi:large subunit ribosomal protein L28
MAAVCELCGKKPGFGMNVSHSHRRTKRRFDPNIQKVRVLVVHPGGKSRQAATPADPGADLGLSLGSRTTGSSQRFCNHSLGAGDINERSGTSAPSP